jgi:hypothetical protein
MMSDEAMKEEIAPVESHAEAPQETIVQEVETAAEDMAKEAVPAAVTGEATGGIPAAAEAAMTAAEDVVAKDLPPIEHDAWAAAKAWVRKELALMQAGHSEETRKSLNE